VTLGREAGGYIKEIARAVIGMAKAAHIPGFEKYGDDGNLLPTGAGQGSKDNKRGASTTGTVIPLQKPFVITPQAPFIIGGHPVSGTATDKAGKPIDKHLDDVWKRALKKAGLRHRPSYQLCHTFVTSCINKGLLLPHIARLIGHSTMDTLVRHYASVIDKATTSYEEKLRSSFSLPSSHDLTANSSGQKAW